MALYLETPFSSAGFDCDNPQAQRTVAFGDGQSGGGRGSGDSLVGYWSWNSPNRLFELNSLRLVQAPKLAMAVKDTLAAIWVPRPTVVDTAVSQAANN